MKPKLGEGSDKTTIKLFGSLDRTSCTEAELMYEVDKNRLLPFRQSERPRRVGSSSFRVELDFIADVG